MKNVFLALLMIATVSLASYIYHTQSVPVKIEPNVTLPTSQVSIITYTKSSFDETIKEPIVALDPLHPVYNGNSAVHIETIQNVPVTNNQPIIETTPAVISVPPAVSYVYIQSAPVPSYYSIYEPIYIPAQPSFSLYVDGIISVGPRDRRSPFYFDARNSVRAPIRRR